MDIGLHHRGIDAHLAALNHTAFARHLDQPLMQLLDGVASYRLGMDVLAEAFAHIPDAPDGRQAAYQQLAHGILTTLATGSVHLKLRHEFFRRKAEAKVKECEQQCQELGERVRYYLDELELSIRESRLPLTLEELDRKRGR